MDNLRAKKAFICDMDGVIYHGNQLLPGVTKFLDWLRKEHKKFLFLTNSSERSPRELREKMLRLTVQISEEHFYTSALATAEFLSRQCPDGSAFVIGEAGLTKALYDADFSMNDKCAAGTGRFLEVMAKALELDLYQLGPMGLRSRAPAKISSICTVFAESEVISMIAARETRENIIAGIHESAAARVAGLASKIKLQAPVVMTGGVAKNIGMVKALENRLGCNILVGKFPQENGAVGAAVLAAES